MESGILSQQLAYSINSDDLQEQAIRLAKLVRCALIYLALAAHRRETEINEMIGNKLVVPMPLFEIDEDLKL